MPPDSTATRSRILDAAFREFARYGLAGARVDRIAASAHANKRAIYDYFGNKEKLFDLTLADVIARGAEEVPALWDDLPEYAGLIYDYFAADPDRMRIHLWRYLERRGILAGEVDAYQAMLARMSESGSAVSGFTPTDLFALVWAMHFTWYVASPALPLDQPRDGAATRRAVVVDAVRRLVAPGSA